MHQFWCHETPVQSIHYIPQIDGCERERHAGLPFVDAVGLGRRILTLEKKHERSSSTVARIYLHWRVGITDAAPLLSVRRPQPVIAESDEAAAEPEQAADTAPLYRRLVRISPPSSTHLLVRCDVRSLMPRIRRAV